MNYVRTFFEKPIATTVGAARESLLAIDFTAIEFVRRENGWLHVGFRSGTQARLATESDIDFLKVFEEYCRDMQSLERGPVRLPPSMNTPKVGRTTP